MRTTPWLLNLQTLFFCATLFMPVALSFHVVQAADSSGKAIPPPVLLPGEYPVSNFNLARGMGFKSHSCLGHVTIGPGIAPDDVDVSYVKENSIRLAIKGTGDTLFCGAFYIPQRRDIAHRTVFRFYDANRWHFDDIDKRTNLRALATPAEAGSSARPAPAPAPGTAATPAPDRIARQTSGNVTKCAGKDGRITYQEGPCPDGKGTKQPAKAGTVAGTDGVLPTVQLGRWRMKVTTSDGREGQSEYCGNPLDNTSEQIAQTVWMRKLGCTVRSTSSSPRDFNMTVDCPEDRVSASGSERVFKGRSTLSVNAPTPQAFTVILDSTATKRRDTTQGVRAGDC